MQGMDAELRGELAELRARAYGPDADLSADPAALGRLQELEDLERRDRGESSTPVVPMNPPTAPSDDPLVAEEREPDLDEPTERATRRPVVRRARTLWLWAGSLAAVAAIASAASIAATTFVPVARTAGVAQVATLQADPAADTAPVRSMGFESDDVSAYADFYGLTTYVGPSQIDAAGTRVECVLLVETATIGKMDDGNVFQGGFRYGGCGAGAFPATVEFVVTPDLPDVFRARFPVGSSVQFVRDGDRVGVFSDAE